MSWFGEGFKFRLIDFDEWSGKSLFSSTNLKREIGAPEEIRFSHCPREMGGGRRGGKRADGMGWTGGFPAAKIL